MKTAFGSGKGHHPKRVLSFLLAVALTAVTAACTVEVDIPVEYNLTVSSTAGGVVTSPGEDTFTYNKGTVVNLLAEADEGHRFVIWTGDVGTIANPGAASTNITMYGNYSINATFQEIPEFEYELTIDSSAGGEVTVPGEGTFRYEAGTAVELAAEAAEGYKFASWTGDVGTIVNVNAASTNITMYGDYSITANFGEIAEVEYELTIDSSAGGEVTVPGEGTFTYDAGTAVDLTAEAAEGYEFANWTGDVDTVADANAASTTITMEGHHSVTANFDKISVVQYELKISRTTGGWVTNPGLGAFVYDQAAVVNLVVTPATGYWFAGWTGDVTNIANVYALSTTITMDDNYSITAVFVRIHRNLVVSSSAGGWVEKPGTGSFTYYWGTVVSLEATPAGGYEFVNWTGDVGTVANINAASTTITIYGDYSIRANFATIQYQLTIDSTEGGTVTTPGEGTVTRDYGSLVDLVATPDTGYQFVEWIGDTDKIDNVNSASTFITMHGDYSITAEFELIEVEVIANLETNLGDLVFGGTHFFHDDGVNPPVYLNPLDEMPDFDLDVITDQEGSLTIDNAWHDLSTLQVVNVENNGNSTLELVGISIMDDKGNPVPEAHLSNYGIAYNMYGGALHGGFVYNTSTAPFFFSIGDQIDPGEKVLGMLTAHVQDGAQHNQTYEFTVKLVWQETQG